MGLGLSVWGFLCPVQGFGFGVYGMMFTQRFRECDYACWLVCVNRVEEDYSDDAASILAATDRQCPEQVVRFLTSLHQTVPRRLLLSPVITHSPWTRHLKSKPRVASPSCGFSGSSDGTGVWDFSVCALGFGFGVSSLWSGLLSGLGLRSCRIRVVFGCDVQG